MADPLTLGALATVAAKAGVGALVAMPVKAAGDKAGAKVKKLFTGDLSKQLEKAFEKASLKFLQTYEGFLDPQSTANLQEMMADDAWGRALAELPLLRHDAINTAACEALFDQMAPQAARGMFRLGWANLRLEFEQAVASSGSDALKSLVDITSTGAAASQRDEMIELSREQTDLLRQFLGQVTEILERQDSTDPESDVESDADLDLYLERLVQDTQDLALKGLDRATKNNQSQTVALKTVYTALLTSHTDDAGPDVDPEQRRRPVSALELLDRHDCLVLLGEPGSGKSTFVNFVSQCLAGERLGHEELNLELLTRPLTDDEDEEPQPWSRDRLVPLRVILRDFAASGLADGSAESFWTFVEQDLKKRRLQSSAEALEQALRSGLLLLDGLDEVPDPDGGRKVVLDSALDFAKTAGCRVLITSRVHPYENQSWSVDGAFETRLAPFSQGQIRRFISLWYEDVVARRQAVFQESPKVRASWLEKAIFAEPRLLELAERPLLLTLMAAVHAWSNTLPRDREQLYREIVDLLLETWNQERYAKDEEGRPILEHPALTAWMQADRSVVRREIERLAYEAHSRQTELSGTADIPQETLLGRLAALKPGCDVNDLEEYLRERAGLLERRGEDTYTFPHRSFQEYLAACHLTNHNWTDFVDIAREDPDRWREVALLMAAKIGFGSRASVWEVARRFCWGEPQRLWHVAGARWGAQIAGQVLAESAVPYVTLDTLGPSDREILDRVRSWLQAWMTSNQPTVERHQAGKNLAILGDPRFDPTLAFLPRNNLGLLPVEAGPFLFGDEQKTEKTGAFWISRWPVTVAQWRAFAEAVGIQDYDQRALQGSDNASVVYMAWHDAKAYCKWLTEQAGIWLQEGRLELWDIAKMGLLDGSWGFRLPSEQEWEKAARGIDGWIYPWGDSFELDHCNSGRAGLGEPSPVGCFLKGRSPFEIEEMSGNVWEWTESAWTESSPDRSRVVRGGSFVLNTRLVRCAARYHNRPGFRDGNLGFRVVLSPIL